MKVKYFVEIPYTSTKYLSRENFVRKKEKKFRSVILI
jgi:hypothetical protein